MRKIEIVKLIHNSADRETVNASIVNSSVKKEVWINAI
jgi:hypothetical protein